MPKPMKIRKLSKHFPVLSLVATSLLFSGSALAQIDADVAAELRAQIAALSSRLEQLESENQEMSTGIEDGKSSVQASAWTEKFKISGDLRPRYEHIDNGIEPSDRNRSRIRARVAITAQVNDDWTATVGMASGGDDPISSNQTLGGGGSTKDMRLDLAYTSYTGFENIVLTAGKYKNVFFKPGGKNLIYDGDYRPAGVAAKYDSGSLFINAGTMMLESDDKFSGQDREALLGLQLGYEMALNNDTSLTLGGSYYDASVKGSQPFFKNDKGFRRPYGNTLDEAGNYVNNYEELEFFAEVDLTLGDRPLSLFGDYVTNLDADDFDTAWLLGAKYGKASGARTWEVGYSYQVLEADAILGSLTDSDFAGGGTDNQGHILNFAYGLGDNTKLGLTYFINEYGEARLGRKVDYNRLHFALQMSF